MNTNKTLKAVLSDLLKHQKVNPTLFARTADIYMQMGKLRNADKILTEGVGNFPDYVPGWIVKGNYHLVQNERENALESYQMALEINPDIPYVHERCRTIAKEKDDSDGYFGHMAELVRLDSMNGKLQSSYQKELLHYIAIKSEVIPKEELDKINLSELRKLLLKEDLLPDEMQRQGRLEVAALFKNFIPEVDITEAEEDSDPVETIDKELNDFKIASTDDEETTETPDNVSEEFKEEEEDTSSSLDTALDELLNSETDILSHSIDEAEQEAPIESVPRVEKEEHPTEEAETPDSVSEPELESLSDDSDIRERLNMLTSEPDMTPTPIEETETETDTEVPEQSAEEQETPVESTPEVEEEEQQTEDTVEIESISEPELEGSPDDSDINQRLKMFSTESEPKPAPKEKAEPDVNFKVPEQSSEEQETPVESTPEVEEEEQQTEDTVEIESISEPELEGSPDDSDINQRLKMFSSEPEVKPTPKDKAEPDANFEDPDQSAEEQETPVERTLEVEKEEQQTEDTDIIESISEPELESPTDDSDVRQRMKMFSSDPETENPAVEPDVRERLTKVASEVIGDDSKTPISKDEFEIKRIPTETLGELYVAQKKWDEAIGVYSALLEEHPTSEKYRNRLQTIYNRKISDEKN